MGLSRLDHVSYVRVRGPAAFELVDRVFPRELYLRDGQLVQGLLLDEHGGIVADCFLAADADDFFLLAEGPTTAALVEHIAGAAGEGEEVEVVGGDETHACIGLDGPYAWELLARLFGQEVIGLPYLTFFHFHDILCCRAGKTGEFGYVLVTPREDVEATWSQLLEAGDALDGSVVGLEELDRCALENWFFNIRAEGRAPVTPLELQLQWRLSRRKSFIGSEALADRRNAGITRRITCLVSPDPVAVGDAVLRDGRPVGSVVNAGFSPARGEWVAFSLQDLVLAHPGIDGFVLGDGAATARSVSPPVLNNRSLYVNPQVHSYATRHEYAFPDLVPNDG